MKFKTGDVVIVKKPKDVYEWPSWVDNMDVFDGTRQILSEEVLEEVAVSFRLEGDEYNYWFNIKWFIPYDDTPFEGNV